MKKSFQIFKRDLGRLFRNRAAVLILVGISVLPSLYAWFNIAANMDPYGNTKGIQVAIANEDKGADSEQMSLDAGQNIVDNLKKNDQLGWKFVDAKEAKKGVRSGKYYAAIVIPDNFSESLLSILSGDIKQPKLDYYINEKKNAIAPKITSKAKTSVQEQVNSSFVSTLAEAMMQVGDAVAGTDVDGGSLADTITQRLNDVSGDLQSYINILNSFASILNSAQSIVATSQVMLPGLDSMVSTGQDTVNSMESLILAGRQIR